MYCYEFYKIGKSLEQYFEHNKQIINIIIDYVQIFHEYIIYDKEHFDNDHICTCIPLLDLNTEFSPTTNLNSYMVGILLNEYTCIDISNIILDFYQCSISECFIIDIVSNTDIC